MLILSEEVYRKTHAGQVERFVADVDTGDGVAWISKAWYNGEYHQTTA